MQARFGTYAVGPAEDCVLLVLTYVTASLLLAQVQPKLEQRCGISQCILVLQSCVCAHDMKQHAFKLLAVNALVESLFSLCNTEQICCHLQLGLCITSSGNAPL